MKLYRYISASEYCKLIDGQLIRPVKSWNRIGKDGFAHSFRGVAFFAMPDFETAASVLSGISAPDYLIEVETEEVGTAFTGRYADMSAWWDSMPRFCFMDEVDFPSYNCYSHKVTGVWRVDGGLRNIFPLPVPVTAADELAV